MSLSDTPSAERVHIGFFGAANAGKSSLVNAVTGQSISLVSPVFGTTTDPVRKAMELLPLGPVVITDTPGFDDTGALGKLRVERTKEVLASIDAAVLVCPANSALTEKDKEYIKEFEAKKIPYVIAYSKADETKERKELNENEIYVSAKSGENINAFKEMLARRIPQKLNTPGLVDSFVKKGDTVILVTPVDEAAPKGRIILPQQQVLRNLLEIGAVTLVLQPQELISALSSLKTKPAAVIADSQAFSFVKNILPDDVKLTSFSIILAKKKGMLSCAIDAVKKTELLENGDRILISEGCTHHRQCNDIGSVKIPAWLKKHTKKELCFDVLGGKEYPTELTKYKMVIHCGGCMITEKEVQRRMNAAKEANVPFVNYGIIIAYMNGILKKSLEVFPEFYNLL